MDEFGDTSSELVGALETSTDAELDSPWDAPMDEEDDHNGNDRVDMSDTPMDMAIDGHSAHPDDVSEFYEPLPAYDVSVFQDLPTDTSVHVDEDTPVDTGEVLSSEEVEQFNIAQKSWEPDEDIQIKHEDMEVTESIVDVDAADPNAHTVIPEQIIDHDMFVDKDVEGNFGFAERQVRTTSRLVSS